MLNMELLLRLITLSTLSYLLLVELGLTIGVLLSESLLQVRMRFGIDGCSAAILASTFILLGNIIAAAVGFFYVPDQ
jgi:hypothetical protein